MSASPTVIDSTYSPWLFSLFAETILYAVGTSQVWLYARWYPKDHLSLKLYVFVVWFFETVQLGFFYRSTHFRLVQHFGIPLCELIWSDSLQMLANYLSQFMVQIYFISRASRRVCPSNCLYLLYGLIVQVTRERVKIYSPTMFGIYVVVLLALVQISAGIAQTIWIYQLRSFSDIDQTKPVTTLQSVASFACDVGITIYLCLFLKYNKNGLPSTESMINSLMVSTISRGMFTTLCSGLTTVVFLKWPKTLWFFLPFTATSKGYLNTMLLSLNLRIYFRDKYLYADRGIHTMEMGSVHTHVQQDSVEVNEPPKERDK